MKGTSSCGVTEIQSLNTGMHVVNSAAPSSCSLCLGHMEAASSHSEVFSREALSIFY